ncbi:MAG: DNA-3-methyladenine glycosylase I, partial [Thermotogota bacterium]|nr:DNA-3-methyladenine glycosylase I [Thermotogota bacterium]
IEASIQNAKAFLAVKKEYGSFDSYIWQFTGGMPKKNAWKNVNEIPSMTPESDAMSKDLMKRGFKFVGPTICYAFMQAVGMVNDHTIDCFRYEEILKLQKDSINNWKIKKAKSGRNFYHMFFLHCFYYISL